MRRTSGSRCWRSWCCGTAAGAGCGEPGVGGAGPGAVQHLGGRRTRRAAPADAADLRAGRADRPGAQRRRQPPLLPARHRPAGRDLRADRRRPQPGRHPPGPADAGGNPAAAGRAGPAAGTAGRRAARGQPHGPARGQRTGASRPARPASAGSRQPGGQGALGGQVVFQGQDPLCGGHGVPLVDKLPDPGGEGELAAAVTASAAGRALRLHRARGVQGTKERLPHPEHLRGPAGGVSRVIRVVQGIEPSGHRHLPLQPGTAAPGKKLPTGLDNFIHPVLHKKCIGH